MNSQRSLEKLLSPKRSNILILGDVMMDRFVYGAVERISPEAPVPVLKFQREVKMPGGAANVARNVCDLGCAVELVGLCGADADGAELKATGTKWHGWRMELVETPARSTISKTRFSSGGQQILRLDMEKTDPANPEEERALIEKTVASIGRCDTVVLSDYAKGTLTNGVIGTAVREAKRRGIPVVADPKSTNFGRYAGATVLTPNKQELARATGQRCEDDDAVISAAHELLDQVEVGALLVTRGGEGMTLVEREHAPVHLRATARQVFDVSGAGDTVAAVLAVLLAGNVPLVEAAAVANIAGGLVVEKFGTATVTRDELICEMQRREAGDRNGKIASLATAARQCRAWREVGERIVFTNGCFDLLHPGHVSLLRQARAAGERLVVGLNADVSVRRLKGVGRPVQDQSARAVVLSAVDAVDLIVVFSEDTPIDVIRELRPDVLVKGADYSTEEVVGWDFVSSYGGALVLAEIAPGHSTTGVINKMHTNPVSEIEYLS
jgi:D-beta-D-heptose 7-phosphate kinase/D-beta-D-heptose 1-phosphate adenosyltransferase